MTNEEIDGWMDSLLRNHIHQQWQSHLRTNTQMNWKMIGNDWLSLPKHIAVNKSLSRSYVGCRADKRMRLFSGLW